jgi:hypothetical protein
MSHSDIARGHESPVTAQPQNNTPDDASVNTTVVSNLSRQENTNMSGLSMVMGLSVTKKRMEEIDKQRDEFTTKRQIMDVSISSSSVTSSVSKLMADILAEIIDMNKMSDKLDHKFNQIIATLASTRTSVATASPPRKVSCATNTPPRETYITGEGTPSTFRWSTGTIEVDNSTNLVIMGHHCQHGLEIANMMMKTYITAQQF